MKVLHLLYSGGIGGTEVLCKDIAQYSLWDNCFCFLSSGGAICDEMENKGVTVFRLYEHASSFAKKLKVLVSFCKKEKFETVFIQHFGFSMDLYYLLLKKFIPQLKGVKILHVVYEPEYTYRGKFKTIKKIAMSKMLKESDMVIGVSIAGKISFQKIFNIPEDKMCVVYNGIGTELLEEGQKNKVSFDGTIQLLYVGRLSAVKGLDLVLNAVAEIKAYPIKFIVVGDGPEKRKLEMMTKTLGIEKIVSFEGFQRNIQDYYKQANVFVYPSVWNEVFGISIVEAMAFGLPCIVNNRGGIPEIVKSGKNGFITSSTDSAGIRNALLDLMKLFQKGEIENISIQAKATAKHFCIINTVKNMEENYKRIIGG